MIISDLKHLASVSDLQRADYEAAGLHLAMSGRVLYSYYRGVYANGRRWIEPDSGVPDDLSVRVNGGMFKSLLNIFPPEAEVWVERKNKSSLTVRTKKQSVVIATEESPADDETVTVRQIEAVASCRTTVEQLLPEVELACEFTAKSYAKPLFTGLQLVFAPGCIGIMAFDGLAALFATYIFKQDVVGAQSASTPAYDLNLGLKLCQTGDVSLELTSRFLYLRGQRADFFARLLDGTWQSFRRITDQKEFANTVVLKSEEIKAVTSAARHLNAASDIEIVGENGRLGMRTRRSGSGQFDVTLDQPADFNQVYGYDAANLQSAALLGPKVRVQIPQDDHQSTLIEARSEAVLRRYWVMQRVLIARDSEKVSVATA